MSQEIKIFQMDEYTWWAASTLEEATADMLEETGMSKEDIADDEAFELSAEQMDTFMLDNHELTADKEKIPFSRALALMIEQGAAFPCFFASTEW